jgi:hypothetical protein
MLTLLNLYGATILQLRVFGSHFQTLNYQFQSGLEGSMDDFLFRVS